MPDKHVLDWMDDLLGSDLGLTAITVAEILYGIGSLPEGKKVLQRDRIGSPISMPDAQIAAICRVASAGLATRNTKDFEYTGLVLINPWEA